MASFSGQDKTPKVDVVELFNLLESNEIKAADDIKRLIQENLATCRDSWLVANLVDHYFATSSCKALAILLEVRDPHDKHLLEKLHDGMKSSEHRLSSLSLLLHIACRDRPLVERIVSHPVFNSIIKCLKTDNDVCNLMTGAMVITILLPSRSVPALISPHLNDIFETFSRLSGFIIKRPGNGSVSEVYVLHLYVAVYALFHRLYGMFPCCFQSYLSHMYNSSKRENMKVYREIIKPMLERVRFHPLLITGSKEWEVSPARWKNMETQDLMIECAKLSLDLIEGTWEENKYSMRPLCEEADWNNCQLGEGGGMVTLPSDQSPGSLVTGFEGGMFWSPSAVVGLCTPPLSQRTTPAPGFQDSTPNSPYYNCGYMINTPVSTPRETPTLHEDNDKKLLKHLSAGNLFSKTTDLKRLSTGSTFSTRSPHITPANSVPASPMRMEFINEPHTNAIEPLPRKHDLTAGTVKSQPKIPAIRELNFADPHPFSESPQRDSHSLEDPPPSPLLPQFRDHPLLLREEATPVSLHAIPQVIQEFGNQDPEGDDREVSELTGMGKTDTTRQQQSAEFLAQFRKGVNRIHFNTLNTTDSVDLLIMSDKYVSRTRSQSCPHIWESLFEDNGDNADQLSRSLSINSRDLQSLEHKHGRNSITKDISAQSSMDESYSTRSVDRQNSTGSQTSQNGPVTSLQNNKTHFKNPTPQLRRATRHRSGQSSGGGEHDFIEFVRNLLQPVCRKCHMDLISSPATSPTVKFSGKEVPLFNTYTPAELLDRHIQLGEDIHTRELGKPAPPNKETANTASYGDEVKILKNRLLLTHNQLMYERHKREHHAVRNRRLLGKIFNAKSREEEHIALADTIPLQEKEIKKLDESLRTLDKKYRQLKEEQKKEEQQKFTQLRDALKENEELKSAKTELNRMLVHQREEQDGLKKTLQATQYQLFNCQKDLEQMEKEVVTTQKLKEQVFQLHKELLLMGELQQKYQEKLQANKFSHTIHPDYKEQISSLKSKIKSTKLELQQKSYHLAGYQAKITELDDVIKNKDLALEDMKKKLETVKSSQEDEIKAVDDKYRSMMKINRKMESEIYRLQSQLDELGWKQSGKLSRPGQQIFSSHIEGYPHSLIEEDSRDRTNSDPLRTSSAKDRVKRMGSVPVNCKMDGGTIWTHTLERSSSSASAESTFEVIENSTMTNTSSSTEGYSTSRTDWYSVESNKSASGHISFYTDSSELRQSGAHSSNNTCDKNGFCS